MSHDEKKTVKVSIGDGYQPDIKGYQPKPSAGYTPERSELQLKPPPKKK